MWAIIFEFYHLYKQRKLRPIILIIMHKVQAHFHGLRALDYLSPLCFALTLEPSSYLHSSCNWAICSHVDLNMASSFSFQSLRILFDTLFLKWGSPNCLVSDVFKQISMKKKKGKQKTNKKLYFFRYIVLTTQ